MKHKIRIFHLPVFLSVIAGIVLMAIVHFTTPDTSLLDYAMSIGGSSTFVCEDGTLWRLSIDRGSRVHVQRTGEASEKAFRQIHSPINAAALLPHEYAMCTEKYRLIFIRGDGSIWLCPNVDPDPANTELIPFYVFPNLSYDESAGQDIEWKHYSGVRGHSGGYVSYYITSPEEQNIRAYLSVELKDGRYYLAEVNALTISTGLSSRYNTYSLEVPLPAQWRRKNIPGDYLIELCTDRSTVFASEEVLK